MRDVYVWGYVNDKSMLQTIKQHVSTSSACWEEDGELCELYVAGERREVVRKAVSKKGVGV